MKIDWETRHLRHEEFVEHNIRVTLDGTDFKIQEPKPFDRAWFSHKFNGPGVRYLVAVSVIKGYIVWTDGPYMCGKWPDRKIANEKFLPWLGENEKYLADRGFRSCQKAITPYQLTGDDNAHMRRFASVARARHESANSRLKNWKILHDVFRHDPMTQQGPVFDAVAKITQIQIVRGQSLFSVEREMAHLLGRFG